jgi:phosphomannomutase
MAADPIKVYDARWEVQEFDDNAVRRLVESTLIYARQLEVDTLTLARDARLGAARVMEIALDVALRAGFRVYATLHPISTPHSYFSTLWVSQQHPRTMGLTITASHNPAQYIGMKFTVPVVHAIGYDCGPMGGLTRVREIYHSNEKLDARPGGKLELLDLTHEYVAFSMRQANVAPDELAGIKLVLDAFHGSCGPELTMALGRAGVDVRGLRLVPDGHFPSGSPNPTSQGKMNAAIGLSREIAADAVFGDSRGILTAGFAFVPILQACLAARSKQEQDRSPFPPVLYDPKVSPLALAEWGRIGARPVLFRNGHSQIKDYMTQIGALAAAEESGHYYHRIRLGNLTISGENSTLTVLLFLAAMRHRPGLMADLWRLQDQVFTTGEFNYQFDSDATRDRALDAVVKHCVNDGCQTTTATPDGIDLQGTCLSRGVRLDPGKVELSPGWYSGYLRVATNEKAVVRSYFSAGDAGVGRTIEQQAREILEKQFGGKVID